MFYLFSVIIASTNFLFTVIAARLFPTEEFSRFLAIWGAISTYSLIGGILQISLASSASRPNSLQSESSKGALFRNQRKKKTYFIFILVMFIAPLMIIAGSSTPPELNTTTIIAFMIWSSCLQLMASILLGLIQSNLKAIHWAFVNVGLALVKTLILFFVAMSSKNALIVATTIVIVNFLMIFYLFHFCRIQICVAQLMELFRRDYGRVISFSFFWFLFHLDLLLVRYYFENQYSAKYALISSIVKSLFALSLLDLWKEYQIHQRLANGKVKVLLRVLRRESIKAILLIIAALSINDEVFQRMFGATFETLPLNSGILLTANIFWSLSYILLLMLKLNNRENIALSAYVLVSVSLYFLLGRDLSSAFGIIQLLISIGFLLTILVIKVNRKIPRAIENLYKRNRT